LSENRFDPSGRGYRSPLGVGRAQLQFSGHELIVAPAKSRPGKHTKLTPSRASHHRQIVRLQSLRDSYTGKYQ
jgi:hypothetical protein